jgi:anaerobic selenocysteine-containing dehydrogenase
MMVSRRTFLTAAGVGGLAATAGTALVAARRATAAHQWTERADVDQFPFTLRPIWQPADAELPDRVVLNGCSFCPSACFHRVHVKQGRVVNVYGEPRNPVQADETNPQDGGLCVKGRVGIVQLLYNKYRITSPLKRVGPKPSMQFQPVSWEQAYREICTKLLEIRDTHGPHTIAGKTTDRVSRDGGPPLFRFLHMLGSVNPTHEGYI